MNKKSFIELIASNKDKFALLDIRNTTLRTGFNRWTLYIIWKGANITPIKSGMGKTDCENAITTLHQYQNYLK